MKDKQKNIDDLFRSGIEQVDSELSADSWNQMNNALDQKLRKKKRRRLGFLLLLLLISLGGYKFYQDGKSGSLSENKRYSIEKPVVAKTESINPQNKNGTAKTATNNSSLTKNNSAILIEGKLNPADKKQEREKISVQSSPEKASESRTVQIVRKKSSVASLRTANNVSVVITAKSNRAVNRKYISEKYSTANKISSPSSGSAKKIKSSITEKQDNINISKENNDPASIADNFSPQKNKENSSYNDETSSNRNKISADKPAESVSENQSNKPLIEALPQADIPEIEKQEKEQVIDSSALNKNIAEVPVEKTRDSSLLKRMASHLSVEAYYSPDMAKRYLKTNENTANTSVQDNASYYDNEKSKYSWSSGLRFNYMLGKRWSVSIGGSYSTYSQSAYQDNIFVQSDSVYKEQHGGHEPEHGFGHGGGNTGGPNHGGGNMGGGHGPGGSFNHNDSLHFVVHTSCGTIDLNNSFTMQNYNSGDTINTKTTTTQTISYLSIPVLLRYQLYGKRLSYYVNAGASLNYTLVDKVTVDIEGYGSLSEKTDGLKKYNVSLLLDAGVSYGLNKHMNAFLEPNIRYSISPINTDSAIQSYPYFIGLRFGLGYKF